MSCSSPHPTTPPSSPCTHTVGTGQTNSFCNDRTQQIVGPPLHRLHPTTQSCNSRIGHLRSRWMPAAACGAAACCVSTSGRGRSESLPPRSADGKRDPHPPPAPGEERKVQWVQGSPHPHLPLDRHPGGVADLKAPKMGNNTHKDTQTNRHTHTHTNNLYSQVSWWINQHCEGENKHNINIFSQILVLLVFI